MEVEKGKGEQNGEKEKENRMATKEDPMETELIKEETSTEETGGKSAKTVDKAASREAAVGGFSGADVKQEPGAEEDDDPVIHEIPVYLSKSIPKLYLFQVSAVNTMVVLIVWYVMCSKPRALPSLNN